MNKMEKKISVIISSYNRGLYLDLTLPTLFNQNVPKDKYEIIIVDDRSTDDTKEIYEKYKNECDLRLIQLKGYALPLVDESLKEHLRTEAEFGKVDRESRNCAIPKNAGLREAKYDLIMFTDPEVFHLKDTIADHLFLLTAPLKKEYNPFECEFKYRESILAGFCYGFEEPPGRPIEKAFFEEFLNFSENAQIKVRDLAIEYKLRNILTPYPFNVGFTKDALFIIGGYKEQFLYWGYEDNDLLTRLRYLDFEYIHYDSVESDENKDEPRWVHFWHPVNRINNCPYNQYLHEKMMNEFLEKKDLALLKGDL